jgi:hypothetical protein
VLAAGGVTRTGDGLLMTVSSRRCSRSAAPGVTRAFLVITNIGPARRER